MPGNFLIDGFQKGVQMKYPNLRIALAKQIKYFCFKPRAEFFPLANFQVINQWFL